MKDHTVKEGTFLLGHLYDVAHKRINNSQSDYLPDFYGTV